MATITKIMDQIAGGTLLGMAAVGVSCLLRDELSHPVMSAAYILALLCGAWRLLLTGRGM